MYISSQIIFKIFQHTLPYTTNCDIVIMLSRKHNVLIVYKNRTHVSMNPKHAHLACDPHHIYR